MSKSNRECALAMIREQFDTVGPITQAQFDEMIAYRRSVKQREEQVQQFIDSVTVGETHFIYFISAIDAGLRIEKRLFSTFDEAVAWFDEYGEFVDQAPGVNMPRLKPKALQS